MMVEMRALYVHLLLAERKLPTNGTVQIRIARDCSISVHVWSAFEAVFRLHIDTTAETVNRSGACFFQLFRF